MRIIKKRDTERVSQLVMQILDILESIPRDAFGNSVDRVDKMSKLYHATAEIAYIIGGVRALNRCIAFFNDRAQSMDEILAISKAHLDTVAKYVKQSNKRRKKK